MSFQYAVYDPNLGENIKYQSKDQALDIFWDIAIGSILKFTDNKEFIAVPLDDKLSEKKYLGLDIENLKMVECQDQDQALKIFWSSTKFFVREYMYNNIYYPIEKKLDGSEVWLSAVQIDNEFDKPIQEIQELINQVKQRLKVKQQVSEMLLSN